MSGIWEIGVCIVSEDWIDKNISELQMYLSNHKN